MCISNIFILKTVKNKTSWNRQGEIYALYVTSVHILHEMRPISWAHLAGVISTNYYQSLFFIFLFILSLYLPSALFSSFISCTFLFSFFFTLPCSASTLPWQRSYRKSLLPRSHKWSGFHKTKRCRERGPGYSALTALEVWTSPFPQVDASIRVSAGCALCHNVIEETC